MPGYKRFRPRRARRARSNARKVLFQKPTANNQKKQIYSLTKKVNYLAKANRQQWHYCDWYKAAAAQTLSQTTESTPVIIPLIAPSTWTQTWQDSGAADTTAKQHLLSMGIKWSVSHATEYESSNVHLFIVKLRPRTAMTTFQSTSQMTTFTSQVHYMKTSAAATGGFNIYKLNPALFQIYYQRHFMLGSYNDSGAATSINTNRSAYQRRGSKFIKFRHPMILDASHEGIATLAYDEVNPQQQFYLIMLTDDVSGDSQSVTYSYNVNYRTRYS